MRPVGWNILKDAKSAFIFLNYELYTKLKLVVCSCVLLTNLTFSSTVLPKHKGTFLDLFSIN